MTTLAYKDGVLAADTQMSSGGIKMRYGNKIKLLPSGVVIAAAGDIRRNLEMEAFFSKPDWKDKLDEAPVWKKGPEAIVLSEGGAYWCQNNCILVPITHGFYAAGSGWHIAMGGMHMGLSAVQAVELASELDIYTNNEVTSFDVKDLPQAATKKRTRRSAG